MKQPVSLFTDFHSKFDWFWSQFETKSIARQLRFFKLEQGWTTFDQFLGAYHQWEVEQAQKFKFQYIQLSKRYPAHSLLTK